MVFRVRSALPFAPPAGIQRSSTAENKQCRWAACASQGLGVTSPGCGGVSFSRWSIQTSLLWILLSPLPILLAQISLGLGEQPAWLLAEPCSPAQSRRTLPSRRKGPCQFRDTNPPIKACFMRDGREDQWQNRGCCACGEVCDVLRVAQRRKELSARLPLGTPLVDQQVITKDLDTNNCCHCLQACRSLPGCRSEGAGRLHKHSLPGPRKVQGGTWNMHE